MLLALDTSTQTAGIALYDGAEVRGEVIWSSPDYHTSALAPAVDELLSRAGVPVSELSAVGVAIGPGSFTGLRIGLALAKGLALARRLPLLGIPSLDILAAAQPAEPRLPLAAVLRAGRGRLAVGWYAWEKKGWVAQGAPEVLTADDLAGRIQTQTRVCGELSLEDRRRLARKRRNVLLASPALSLRRPSYLAELAWRRLWNGEKDDPLTLSPLYLHYNDPVSAA